MTDKEEIKDSLVEEFHNNGQLKSRGNYKNGKRDGLWETFYWKSNNNPFILHGQLWIRGNYKDGKIYGLYELFHENGQLQEKGNIKDGELVE